MSVELLRKSLHFIEQEDGLNTEKKKKKAARVSTAIRERQRVRALASRMEFDCEIGDFVEDLRRKRRRQLDNDYGTGISLVERHRAMKHVDALKRNIKYMVYTNERKLDSNKVESIIELMSRRERDEKQMRQQLLNQNDGVREPNPFKRKREMDESVFTDEDFMRVGPDRAKIFDNILRTDGICEGCEGATHTVYNVVQCITVKRFHPCDLGAIYGLPRMPHSQQFPKHREWIEKVVKVLVGIGERSSANHVDNLFPNGDSRGHRRSEPLLNEMLLFAVLLLSTCSALTERTDRVVDQQEILKVDGDVVGNESLNKSLPNESKSVFVKSVCYSYSETVDPDKRIVCFPAPGTTQLASRCAQVGCIYDRWPEVSTLIPEIFYIHPVDFGIPACYFPRRSGYVKSNETASGVVLESYPNVSNPYGDNISPILFKYSKIGSTINVRIGPEKRYEPQLDLPRESYDTGEEIVLEQSDETGVFAFRVKRALTNQSIWDTTIGGLMFSDQYIQIAAFIGSSEIYGIGEHAKYQLKACCVHTWDSYETWPMFSRDQFPSSDTSNENLYGAYPFYIGVEDDGKAHGVLILNSNAQEIMLGPAPHLVYRTIGGMLDIYFFPGPYPEDVVRQYVALVGKPALPPYWAFGYQVRFDLVLDASQHPCLMSLLFLFLQNWTELPTYIKQLHDQSMHAILIFDPAIQVDSESFQRGINANAKFVEWERDDQVPRAIQDLYPLVSNTKIMLGTVWPLKHVAFPDFSAPETQEWWKNEIVRFHAEVGFDGMWIDMNEPTNIGTNENDTQPITPNHSDRPYIAPLMCPLNGSDSTYDMPPYETYNVFVYEHDAEKSYLSSKTLCMLGMTKAGRIYDTKSLYGFFESIATRAGMEAATSKRPLVLTRSSFPSGGRYAGHWLGDNLAAWGDLQVSISGIQDFSMFGIPYVGADICGFRGNTTEGLCLRWHQLGAFYTFSSLHYFAATSGSTVVRPLFFEFPKDHLARFNDGEFMWGEAMLIIPAIDIWPEVYAYLPQDASWYSLRDADYGIKTASGLEFVNAGIEDVLPVFIRVLDDLIPGYVNACFFHVIAIGGYIIPRQAPEMTTIASRKNPLELVIALNGIDIHILLFPTFYLLNSSVSLNRLIVHAPDMAEASGRLFWDDGESPITPNCCSTYQFEMRANSTHAEFTVTGYAANITIPPLNVIDIFGYDWLPHFEAAVVNGVPRSLSDCASYDSAKRVVSINCTNLLDISSVGKSISWSHTYSETVDPEKRVECFPAPGTTQLESRCAQVGCIYDRLPEFGIPACYFPPKSGYVKTGTTSDGVVLESYRPVSNPYGDNISPIFFKYSRIGSTLNIRIGPEGRYEPPLNLPRESYDTGEEFVVEQTTETGVFAFKVKRPSANESIWDTTIGGLMFADQYIQIAAFIGSSEIYGLGEHTRSRLRHAMDNYETWPMFSRDQFPSSSTSNQNLYGAYPFYIAVEHDRRAHGVLIVNSNAQELMFGPAPHLVYRTIGGMLDIYFFPGPSAEDVVRQYAALVGKPALPPYWAFGYQVRFSLLCKYGYKSLAELKETISAVQEAGIPLDVVYADIDHMDLYQDFTLGQAYTSLFSLFLFLQNWTELPTYIKQLHDQSMHAILIFDPAIQVDSESFQRGINANAKFVEWERNDQVPRAIQDLYPLVSNTKIMLGTVWPLKHVAFPDFTAAETREWWKNEIVRFHAQVGFDGMWIDMNEPTNIGTNENDTQPITPNHSDRPYIAPLMCPLNGSDSKYDMPPYETYNVFVYEHDAEKSYLSSKTLCMLGVTRAGRIYDTKSLYGFYESIATRAGMEAATSKRPLVLTRSSFPSGGRYAGHWLGDNLAAWGDLLVSVVGIQEFSIFGIPYVGADICGFRGNTTEELCLRWHQLGAFYTFSRNHNDIGQVRQDPAAWPSVAAATRQVYLFRYRYLPYLYTLHYLAATTGSTVVRPLFFEFPNDEAAHASYEQFMWGEAMLIAPVLRQRSEEVYAYLPQAAVWYSLRDGDYGVKIGSGFTFLSAPLDQLPPVLIRGQSTDDEKQLIDKGFPRVLRFPSGCSGMPGVGLRLISGEYVILQFCGYRLINISMPRYVSVCFSHSFALGGCIVPRQAPEMTTIASRKNPLELVIALNEKGEASGSLFWDDGESPLTSNCCNIYQFKFRVNITHAEFTVTGNSANRTIPPLNVIEIFGYDRTPYLGSAKLEARLSPLELSERKLKKFGSVVENSKGMLYSWKPTTLNSQYSYQCAARRVNEYLGYSESEAVDPEKRIDCLPGSTTGSLSGSCARVGCFYDPYSDYGIPACYYPRRSGYIKKDATTDGVLLESHPAVANPYGDNISPIFFRYSRIGSTLNIRIGPEGRYEPPLNLPRESYDTGEELVVEQTTETGVFAFKVKRPSANESIWDTTIGEGRFRFVSKSIAAYSFQKHRSLVVGAENAGKGLAFSGGLMFADQYVQIAAYIGSSEIYGLGEHTRSSLRGYRNASQCVPIVDKICDIKSMATLPQASNTMPFSYLRCKGRLESRCRDMSSDIVIKTAFFEEKKLCWVDHTAEFHGCQQRRVDFQHSLTAYTTWPMFARDQFPSSSTSNQNLYGVYPFYIAIENDHKAHGVLILNSNAQELMIGPAPHIVYRTIGGMLDIYFFPGPRPEDVVRQYAALVGKPAFPPYWGFGYQLCKYGYRSLAELKETISAVQEAGVPLDVVYADIDHMDLYQDFTLGQAWTSFISLFLFLQNWTELPTYVKQLHDQSMHAILIFDPAIQVDSESFQRGINASAKFVEWERNDQVPRAIQDLYPLVSNTKIMLGTVWPLKHVAFPDFTAPETQEWWKNEIVRFHAEVGFDGMWIDMNEPTNIGTNENDTQPITPNHSDRPYIAPLMCPLNGSDSKYDVPPYETYNVFVYKKGTVKSYLSSKTLCMLGMTKAGRIYDTKSLYGFFESVATRAGMEAATSKRPAVITRSSFPSGGRYAGHWLGDNLAAWGDLLVSVVGIQEFSIFGIPYVGADICGFRGNTTEELCLRWHQLGAFYTFSRNHNDIGQVRQDPAAWPSVAAATRQVYLFRYSYLPYLYTLHYLAATTGSTVVRPLFFEFPNDEAAHANHEQFMWGEAMLIAPVLRQGAREVYAYLPREATWYSLRDTDYGVKTGSGFTFLSAPLDQLPPVLIRGSPILLISLSVQKASKLLMKAVENGVVELSSFLTQRKGAMAPTIMEHSSRIVETWVKVLPFSMFNVMNSSSPGVSHRSINIISSGGCIIPRQAPEMTTIASRKNPLELVIALNGTDEASGTLFWDDGESPITPNCCSVYQFKLRVSATFTEFTVTGYSANITIPSLNVIDILGYDRTPNFETAVVNGIPRSLSECASYDSTKQIVSINCTNLLDISSVGKSISWSNTYSETVDPDKRVECFPAPGTTQLESRCAQVGCIYDRLPEFGIPACYFPPKSGYVKTGTTSDGVVLESYRPVSNPYGDNISPIFFKYSRIGSTLNIRIGPEGRYEPPLNLPRESYDTGEEFVVQQTTETGVFAFKVKRPSANESIWDTTIGGLMFADQYIQIAAFIGSSGIYGLGEHAKYRLMVCSVVQLNYLGHPQETNASLVSAIKNMHVAGSLRTLPIYSFQHAMDNYETWPMFSRDQFPSSSTSNQNLYGAYPFYIAVEKDYKAHGVLIVNSNAQELMIGPAPHIVYRTIGGMLDIYFFPGPRPEDVVRQYAALVGKPAFPPYWGFGYQNWTELPTYIKQLHDQSMHAILIFDPAIQVDSESFQRGISASAKFVEWERNDQVPRAIQDLYPLVNNTKIMLGTVWPLKHVAFPDFSAPETQEWWKNEIVRFHAEVGFDGMWIDMNEPTNIGTNENDTQPITPNHSDRPYIAPLMCPLNGSDSTYDMPPYETYNVFVYEHDAEKSYLSSKTLCMLGMTKAGRIYDTKSLYGFYESIATRAGMEAATSKRPLVLTRSSFPSGGRYAGHWLGDNSATWEDLHESVVGIQDFSMFGIPYVGADICGFRGNTTAALCLRWHQLGAFYTFSRNHNDIGQIRQDPAAWPTVADATRQVYLFRYRYLPYLYTLHYLAATSGSTVVRPLFFEFPTDPAAYVTDEQFMWGDAMLIAPPLSQSEDVRAYFPQEATWYSLRDTDYGMRFESGSVFVSAALYQLPPVFIRGEPICVGIPNWISKELRVLDDVIPGYVNACFFHVIAIGGYIIPRQAPEMTTIASRKNPLELVIALNDITDCALEKNEASGSLFWDDGESPITPNCCNIYQFNFRVNSTSAELTITGYSANVTVPALNVIDILGYGWVPMFKTAMVNGVPRSLVDCSTYNPVMHIVYINCTDLLDISSVGKSIVWSNMYSEVVDQDKRIDCLPAPTTDSLVNRCAQVGCIYDYWADYGIPECYFPRRSGYIIKGTTTDGVVLESYPGVSNPYGDNISPIFFKYSQIGSTVNIRIGPEGRYEPQLSLPRESYDTGEELVVQQTTETGVFAFKVKRPSANESIWDTTIGGLMFADQYIQIAAFIGSSEIFGLGEHTRSRLRVSHVARLNAELSESENFCNHSDLNIV
uniref:Maltase n=1 Tax=Ascaris lumbricoides TaxID=6252 RepID=A0A9J2PBC3_ASCLU